MFFAGFNKNSVTERNTLVARLSEKPIQSHPTPFCCLPQFKPGPLFLVITKQFILQYVLVKPVLGIAAGILQALGLYHEGSFSPMYGYFYVALITNISVTFSIT